MSIKKIVLITIVVVIVIWTIALLTKPKVVYVTWQEVQKLFADCQVESVTQDQTLELNLTLKDGSVVLSKSPNITTVAETISHNASKCGEVRVDLI